MQNYHLSIEPTTYEQNYKIIKEFRSRVYVTKEDRLVDVEDFSNSFDNYNSNSVYFIAKKSQDTVGLVKVINGNLSNLPCEEVASINHLRSLGTVVEVGHLLVINLAHNYKVVLELMKRALEYSFNELKASYILADVFVDGKNFNYKNDIYHQIGFVDIYGPYQDKRFKNSPRSLLIALEKKRLLDLYLSANRSKRRLLGYVIENIALA